MITKKNIIKNAAVLSIFIIFIS